LHSKPGLQLYNLLRPRMLDDRHSSQQVMLCKVLDKYGLKACNPATVPCY
jgi:hypothetical protein